MIALLGASAMVLAGLQASINVPRDAFRNCLKEASTKATSEKVAPDAIEAYLKTACSGQLGSLRNALLAFDLKNGMAHKVAESDASSTVDDYMSGPIEHYKFDAASNTKAAPPAPAAPMATNPAPAAAKPVTPAPTAASAPATPPSQPPKP